MTGVPEIAILGHPNEGKSSVLSTLAEDDSVRISPTPGETTACRTFPIIIDGREVLRFTDTPGFQNPSRVLAEMRRLSGEGQDPVQAFRQQFGDADDLRDDVELLSPLARGAGIIYVVDGSRPVRNVDRAEMEILRLCGRPRLAVINCKEDQQDELTSWKNEFRKNFNANRLFNAHRATYAERISLLEALKAIDQDWQAPLDQVVRAFKADWQARNTATVEILLAMIRDNLSYSISDDLADGHDSAAQEKRLADRYRQALEDRERQAHQKIRALFKHHIFQYTLPPQSLLNEELFGERTWSLLGMSPTQVAIASALGGAVVGAKLDLLTAGLSFGVFTGLGGAAGALGALYGGRKLTATARELLGIRIGGEKLKIGPAASIDLLLILINRGLLFYRHTINWAHGRRDYQAGQAAADTSDSRGYTSAWPAARLRVCKSYFTAITEQRHEAIQEHGAQLAAIVLAELDHISQER
ncbi:MAG: GTPase/DUF3482 domain-containing protein [Desulfopila sp.]